MARVFALIALATLAACSSYEPPRSAALVATPVAMVPGAVLPLRPGIGRVEAILPMIDSEGGIRRLSLRMDDGGLQVADSRGPYIALGQQVEITPDSHIVYRAPRRYSLAEAAAERAGR